MDNHDFKFNYLLELFLKLFQRFTMLHVNNMKSNSNRQGSTERKQNKIKAIEK